MRLGFASVGIVLTIGLVLAGAQMTPNNEPSTAQQDAGAVATQSGLKLPPEARLSLRRASGATRSVRPSESFR